MRALVLLVLASAIAGCGGHDWNGLWREDFETTCDGAPCGWTQVSGPAGAVTWIETGPSEHGVEMTGDGLAIAIMPSGDEVVGSDPVSSLQGHVVARCDRGAQLALIVTVQNLAGGPAVSASGTATYPSTWDGTRTTFDLFADDTTQQSAQFTDLLSVVLHKTGPGTCEIDYVSLADQSTPFPE